MSVLRIPEIRGLLLLWYSECSRKGGLSRSDCTVKHRLVTRPTALRSDCTAVQRLGSVGAPDSCCIFTSATACQWKHHLLFPWYLSVLLTTYLITSINRPTVTVSTITTTTNPSTTTTALSDHEVLWCGSLSSCGDCRQQPRLLCQC